MSLAAGLRMRLALVLALGTIVLAPMPARAVEPLLPRVDRHLRQRQRDLGRRINSLFHVHNQGPLRVRSRLLDRLGRELTRPGASIEQTLQLQLEAPGPAREQRVDAIDRLLGAVDGLATEPELRRGLAEQLMGPTVPTFAQLRRMSPISFLKAELVLFTWQMQRAGLLSGLPSPSPADRADYQGLLHEVTQVHQLGAFRERFRLALADPSLPFLTGISSAQEGLVAVAARRASLEAAVSKELEDTVVDYLETTARDQPAGLSGFRESGQASARLATAYALEPRLRAREGELILHIAPVADRVAVRRLLMTLGHRHDLVDSLDHAEETLRGLSQTPIP